MKFYGFDSGHRQFNVCDSTPPPSRLVIRLQKTVAATHKSNAIRLNMFNIALIYALYLEVYCRGL
jgi:hypothetical protein